MTSPAGTPGPHVFVESLSSPQLADDDLGHLAKALRMRSGDALTMSDGQGSWCTAEFHESGLLEPTSEPHYIKERPRPLTIAFSLVKGSKPELIIQKLTELGLDRIVVLSAARSIVRWDKDKAVKAASRWERIAREAAMQSHRVRLPQIDAVVPAGEWLTQSATAIAHFGGSRVDASVTSIAIGPEGGWDDAELALADESECGRVSLGHTVLRAETAAIAAGTLLTAAATSPQSDGG